MERLTDLQRGRHRVERVRQFERIEPHPGSGTDRSIMGDAAVHAAALRGVAGIEDIDGLHSHDETRRQEPVRQILEKGTDPDIVAGNGHNRTGRDARGAETAVPLSAMSAVRRRFDLHAELATVVSEVVVVNAEIQLTARVGAQRRIGADEERRAVPDSGD